MIQCSYFTHYLWFLLCLCCVSSNSTRHSSPLARGVADHIVDANNHFSALSR